MQNLNSTWVSVKRKILGKIEERGEVPGMGVAGSEPLPGGVPSAVDVSKSYLGDLETAQQSGCSELGVLG